MHMPHLITQESLSSTSQHLILNLHGSVSSLFVIFKPAARTERFMRTDESSLPTLHSDVVTCSSTGQIRHSDERGEIDTGRLVNISLWLWTVGHAPRVSHRQPEMSASAAGPQNPETQRSSSDKRHENKQT